MIHPSFETVNFETMEDARQPKTNRELMIQLGEQVKKLSEALDRFADRLEKFEEEKVVAILERISKLERWQSEWNGTWKFWIIVGGAAALVFSFLSLLKK